MAQDLIHLYKLRVVESAVSFYRLSTLPPDELFPVFHQEVQTGVSSSFHRLLRYGYAFEVFEIASSTSPNAIRKAKLELMTQPEQNVPDFIDQHQTGGPIRCIICRQSTYLHDYLPNTIICSTCKTSGFRLCSTCKKIFKNRDLVTECRGCRT
jgi:hypothetical protein